MKPILLIILIIFSFFLFGQSQQVKAEWFSKVKFSKIHELGKRHLFYQYCIEDSDSLISNGSISFVNCSIGNIEKCKYHINLKDTIIYEISIQTKRKVDTENLLQVLDSKYKLSKVIDAKSLCETYFYSTSKENDYFYILLNLSKNRKNAYLKMIYRNSSTFEELFD